MIVLVRGWRCTICGYEVLDNLPAPRPFARLATHFRRHPGAPWRANCVAFKHDADTAPVDKR